LFSFASLRLLIPENVGEFAEIEFAVSEQCPLHVQKYVRNSQSGQYGRIVFRKGNQIVMIGRVVDVDYDTDPLFVFWVIKQILSFEYLVPDVVRYILLSFVYNACGRDSNTAPDVYTAAFHRCV
jgi:hypothetical protein